MDPSIAQGTLVRLLPDYAQEAPVCVEFLKIWFDELDRDTAVTQRLQS